MRVLVVNAGSSTLKLRLLGDGDETLARRDLDASGGEVEPELLLQALREGLGEADAVAHRIVHGGVGLRSPARVDAALVRALRELTELAPLHQPKSLAALEAVGRLLPAVPAVACFDTAFHATLPAAAATYALPAAWRERWPLRRYGFHGLSHAWVARRVPELLGREPSPLRIVSCHLGAGASLCAIRDGESVDTTMGFTPLEGLVMATRSGSVDPGLVLWLLANGRASADEVAHALEHESGLLGLAGTADMRTVLERVEAGQEAARLALDVYLHRLVASVAAMAAALGGLDVLVFTGGVGERAARLRREVGERLSFLGVAIDPRRNAGAEPDCEVSEDGAGVCTLVLAAREDLEMARQARAALSLRDSRS